MQTSDHAPSIGQIVDLLFCVSQKNTEIRDHDSPIVSLSKVTGSSDPTQEALVTF
jgi:hypothetical protein